MSAPKTNSSVSSKPAALNKLDGVRKALATLGNDAKPVQIQDFVKRTFGLEMTTGHISANKSDILKKQGLSLARPTARKTMRKPASRKPSTALTPGASTPAHALTGAEHVRIEDLLTVKDLVGRVGAGALKELINILVKA